MKRTLIVGAAAAILLAGCSSSEKPAAAPVDPWVELCDTYCGDLSGLTADSFQTCGRAAGASQAACLDTITSKIYEIEGDLPDDSQPKIQEDIDTIRETSQKYSDANCDSGRMDGLAGATCTIQSITIEKRARTILAQMQSRAAS